MTDRNYSPLEVSVVGMPEFDALIDHIYEEGTNSEGVIPLANKLVRAAIQSHIGIRELLAERDALAAEVERLRAELKKANSSYARRERAERVIEGAEAAHAALREGREQQTVADAVGGDAKAPAISRKEFVRAYAARSGLDDKWAALGFIDMDGGGRLIALPCECTDEGCEGWAMLSAESALSHLELYAPEPIRSAFRAWNNGKAVLDIARPSEQAVTEAMVEAAANSIANIWCTGDLKAIARAALEAAARVRAEDNAGDGEVLWCETCVERDALAAEVERLREALEAIIARSYNDPLGTSKVIDMRRIAEDAARCALEAQEQGR